ncbi:hypothetical protein K525DRAFT_230649 [Schizophyllum commune Loenen D]|nr:hypothetical protein K525DRAFT_230649 [Schizophyllum commune Loenen D]
MHSHSRASLLLIPLLFIALLGTPSRAAIAPDQITHLVTFGDSYTDIFWAGDGGRAWPLYVMDYVNGARGTNGSVVGNQAYADSVAEYLGGGSSSNNTASNGSLTLHPYAMAGGICSHALNLLPWPSVFEDELPPYLNDSSSGVLGDISAENTLYSLWIGTNDVGPGALLTGEAADGVTVVDTVGCAVNWVKTLYDKGARNFLFQNMNPLEKTPMYSRNGRPTGTWTAAKNATEWNIFMQELTTAGNKIAELLLRQLALSLDGAHVALFDSHSLFTEMIANPGSYLNGTAPLNVTAAIRTCDWKENQDPTDTVPCTVVNGTDRDSYMWQDELHPSEQANRIVAQQIAQVVQGENNEYTTWLS